MPNKAFLGEVIRKHICEACKRKRHQDCDGSVPRGYDESHDHPCDCDCHKPHYDK